MPTEQAVNQNCQNDAGDSLCLPQGTALCKKAVSPNQNLPQVDILIMRLLLTTTTTTFDGNNNNNDDDDDDNDHESKRINIDIAASMIIVMI